MRMTLSFRFSVLLLAATTALAACSENKDDKGDKPQDQVERKSVVGAATKPGVFPDGSQAQPLNEEQVKTVGKMVEGLMSVNTAVGNVSAPQGSTGSGSSAGSEVVQMIQAALANPLIVSMVKNPQRLLQFRELRSGNPIQENAEKLKLEVQKNCRLEQSNNQPQESGTDDNKIVTLEAWSKLGGFNCPVGADFQMNLRAQAQRLGENSGKLTGGASFYYTTQLHSADYQQVFDFQSETIQGSFDGQVIIRDRDQELAANAGLDARILTVANGQVQAQILMDAYLKSQAEVIQNAQATVAIILKTQQANVLLQIFANVENEKDLKIKAYLNGQELQVNH